MTIPTNFVRPWLQLVFLGVIFSTVNLKAAPQEVISQQELQDVVAQGDAGAGSAANLSKSPGLGGMNFLRLLLDGGALMIPIGIMSLLVVAIGVERWYALRTACIFPRRLRREIRRTAEDEFAISPAELYRSAELFPSSAGRVLRDMLVKVGRPTAEVEAAAAESIQREADRLFGNVRWLTLAAAVTPLLGLLGTVWGMIIAFYNTTQLTSGSNRVESLAEGIYVALVTTLAGLAVAIPAAILAHYFEGKIIKGLGIVDVELRQLIPKFESFEGRMRFDITSRGISSRPAPQADVSVAVEPPPAPPVRASKLKA